jgi:hypothetical protein
MTIYDDTKTLADQLSVAEKVRLIEYLSGTLRENLETEAFRQMPWQEFWLTTRLNVLRNSHMKSGLSWNEIPALTPYPCMLRKPPFPPLATRYLK